MLEGAGQSTTSFPAEWEGQFLGGPLTAFEPRVSTNGDDVAFEAEVGNVTQVGVLKPASGAWTVMTSDTLQGFVSNTHGRPMA